MKRILTTLIALTLAKEMMGAITQSDHAGNGAATVSSLTVPLTNNASGNTMITVNTQAKDASNRTVTNVTYGGVGMTKACSTDDATLQDATSNWFLLNPATGSNNFVIFCSGTASTLSGEGATWSGVQQSGQPDSTNTFIFATRTAASITNTCVNSGCMIQDNLIKTLTTGSVTPGGGQTILDNASVTAYWAASTYLLNGVTGTNIFTYTFSITSTGQNCITAYIPASGAATPAEDGTLLRQGCGQ